MTKKTSLTILIFLLIFSIDLFAKDTEDPLKVINTESGKRVIHYGKDITDRPFLGVNSDPSYRGKGVIVKGVHPNGPAKTAGILIDDVILSVDSSAVKSVNDLFSMITSKKSGDTVRLKIERQSKIINFEVKLTSVGKIYGTKK